LLNHGICPPLLRLFRPLFLPVHFPQHRSVGIPAADVPAVALSGAVDRYAGILQWSLLRHEATVSFLPFCRRPAQVTRRISMKKIPLEVEVRTTNDWFGRFAALASSWLGSKWAFSGAAAIIAMWAMTGPVFRFSNTWQLVINTGTTIVTFLMVFLIQNTQNRDARAINLKLNELIRATAHAGNQMIDIETLSDLELDALQAKYEQIRNVYFERKERAIKHHPGKQ
jgi:low affinity Fe/Cu permease